MLKNQSQSLKSKYVIYTPFFAQTVPNKVIATKKVILRALKLFLVGLVVQGIQPFLFAWLNRLLVYLGYSYSVIALIKCRWILPWDSQFKLWSRHVKNQMDGGTTGRMCAMIKLNFFSVMNSLCFYFDLCKNISFCWCHFPLIVLFTPNTQVLCCPWIILVHTLDVTIRFII